MEILKALKTSGALENVVGINIPARVPNYDDKKVYYAKIGKYYFKAQNDTGIRADQIRMSMIQRNIISQDDLKAITFVTYENLIKQSIPTQKLYLKLITSIPLMNTFISLERRTFTEEIKQHILNSKMFFVNDQEIAYIVNPEPSKRRDNVLTFTVGTESVKAKTKTFIVTPFHITNETLLYIDIVDGLNIMFADNKPVLNMMFNLLDLGIGGLDKEFAEMFRRAFASRMIDPQKAKKMGIKHIKGILLHGPPGCGKTLIARKICKMINSVEPKIVNGPELLNKYVGESEANMRRLFADAEAEFKAKGENSRLHVIVFDEIDSICKKRGTTTGGSGVNDSIVNQLLTKFDGVDEFDNFLIIGMTNRPDMLDDALLRPGRFELKLEINLPNEKGRLDILNIHTKKLYETNTISKDINLETIATKISNYTGAEIEGLVNSARSYAIHRATDFNKESSTINIDDNKIMVSEDDFDKAIKEIVPKFGLDNTVMMQKSKYGIMNYSKEFTELYGSIIRDIVRFVWSPNDQMINFVIGEKGSGRTNLALHVALRTNYPTIKYICGKSLIGMSEQMKANYIEMCLNDADKSDNSVIIFDDIGNIIDWVYSSITGAARFSHGVCGTLRSLLNYNHKGKRLIIFTFDILTYSDIMSVDILPKCDREYTIPKSSIDHNIQNDIAKINNSNEIEIKTSIDRSLPIKQYIFEYNNNIDIDY